MVILFLNLNKSNFDIDFLFNDTRNGLIAFLDKRKKVYFDIFPIL